jgi:hypothetical protein
MAKLPKPTPKAFWHLPPHKKVDLVAKHYIDLCTNERLFIGSKITPRYYGLCRHFDTRPIEQLHALWEFLLSFTRKEPMDLATFYRRADNHRKKLISEANTRRIAELKVEQQEEISLDDVLKL